MNLLWIIYLFFVFWGMIISSASLMLLLLSIPSLTFSYRIASLSWNPTVYIIINPFFLLSSLAYLSLIIILYFLSLRSGNLASEMWFSKETPQTDPGHLSLKRSEGISPFSLSLYQSIYLSIYLLFSLYLSATLTLSLSVLLSLSLSLSLSLALSV